MLDFNLSKKISCFPNCSPAFRFQFYLWDGQDGTAWPKYPRFHYSRQAKKKNKIFKGFWSSLGPAGISQGGILQLPPLKGQHKLFFIFHGHNLHRICESCRSLLCRWALPNFTNQIFLSGACIKAHRAESTSQHKNSANTWASTPK